MKKVFVIPVLFLAGITTAALLSFSHPFTKKPDDEKYKVIKVNGQIIIKRSGKSLSTGDELLSSTPLDFKTTDSRAAVISPSKGRFVLTAQANTGKTNLVPGMNNVASRAGALLNIIDLKNHFSGDYVVLEKNKLKISKEAYPMSQKNFFFLRFEYNGESINKRLDFEGDSLVLDRAAIFKIDEKPVAVTEKLPCGLYYRISESNENKPISNFNAVFPDLAVLKTEVQVILDNCSGKKTSERVDEVSAYINEFYGKPDKDNLLEWLQKNFAIK